MSFCRSKLFASKHCIAFFIAVAFVAWAAIVGVKNNEAIRVYQEKLIALAQYPVRQRPPYLTLNQKYVYWGINRGNQTFNRSKELSKLRGKNYHYNVIHRQMNYSISKPQKNFINKTSNIVDINHELQDQSLSNSTDIYIEDNKMNKQITYQTEDMSHNLNNDKNEQTENSDTGRLSTINAQAKSDPTIDLQAKTEPVIGRASKSESEKKSREDDTADESKSEKTIDDNEDEIDSATKDKDTQKFIKKLEDDSKDESNGDETEDDDSNDEEVRIIKDKRERKIDKDVEDDSRDEGEGDETEVEDNDSDDDMNALFTSNIKDIRRLNSIVDQEMVFKYVLILVRDSNSPRVFALARFFSEQRILFKIVTLDNGFPFHAANPHTYSLIVFDEFIAYVSMPTKRKRALDRYCEERNIGILAFARNSRTRKDVEDFDKLRLKIQHRVKLKNFRLEPRSGLWRVAKTEAVYRGDLPLHGWSIFKPSHPTYRPLAYSSLAEDKRRHANFDNIVAVLDTGLRDNIEKVILGHGVNFWLNSIIAMDAINYLSNGELKIRLDRFLQVDIDGIFVGKPGTRLLPKDVESMVDSQEFIRKRVPGFQWTLGFSGAGYEEGTAEEDKGDRKFVEIADEFVWFNQMYQYEQPHQLKAQDIERSIDRNLEFAKKKDIRVSGDYMVPPHQSGVYPMVEGLYDTWLKLGRVFCSSTDLYPRHEPTWGRRGFHYRSIRVVPRQTFHLEDFKDRRTDLDASIQGGYLFKLFLFTPVMIFRTQMSNYGKNRVAQYTFEKAVDFIDRWTNLKMKSFPPKILAQTYFALYPHERFPVWVNPCIDNTLKEIWPKSDECGKFPQVVIVGPQKTGTSALHNFLGAHPSLQTSNVHPFYHEEVQFFNDRNYFKGVDWYIENFENVKPGHIQFEKSANYFDLELTAKRMFEMIPNAKIIVILADPARRAYSWYQNLRAHNDEVVRKYSFYEIVSAKEGSAVELWKTRTRCIRGGEYAKLLDIWLEYFPKEQIYLVDSDALKLKPMKVLNKVQRFIGVKPFIDYNKMLRFDRDKGFFCLVGEECLGDSKGRIYPPMDDKSRRFLDKYFAPHNERLRALLRYLGRPFPGWLE